MILAGIGDIVKVPFGWLLAQLYNFTESYGLALIIFAILVKVVLLPATAKGKKSSMKMSRLSPRLKAIQEKYADDKQRQSAEIQALYKTEGVSMGGGCLWSFLPILILIPLYAVVRQPLQYMLQESAEVITKIITALTDAGVENLGDSNAFREMVAASEIANYKEQLAGIEGIKPETLNGMNFTFLGIDLGAVPEWKFWTWQITEEKNLWYYIGGALMPILSAGGQLVSMVLSQRMNNSVITNDKGIQDKEAAKESQSNQQMKMMMWVSPLMSLFFGFSFMPAALSLYWFVQGIVTTLSDIYLTKKYRKIYDAEDAERLKKHMEEEAAEAEKERIRAERRAANPEGITTNTSKKKLQQAKRQSEEATKAANAKEYAAKKGDVEEVAEENGEAKPLSGINSRPNCRGRAYDPNRYNTEE